ncbi:MAG: sulfatase, partial [Acidobacteriia bacterium]|nr:sulfatase [Terriglobia bacterium]
MDRRKFLYTQTRRDFFRRCAGGVGTMALAELLTADGLTAAATLPEINPLAPREPHYADKAKAVIYMLIEGRP